jgi:hypothetical protein
VGSQLNNRRGVYGVADADLQVGERQQPKIAEIERIDALCGAPRGEVTFKVA